MNRTVYLSAKAEQDIDRVVEWLSTNLSASIAKKWCEQVNAKLELLETNATSFGIVRESKELGIELHETIVGKRTATYRIIYAIREKQVLVVRVLRGRQDELKISDL